MRPKTEDEKEEETQQRMVSLILLNGGAKTKTLELSQKNMCAAFSSPSCCSGLRVLSVYWRQNSELVRCSGTIRRRIRT